MSTISSVSVSPLAYKKIIHHTAKYTTARVLGFLLSSSSPSSSSPLSIVDSIPLSHHWTALAPMAEVALSLATAYASSKNLSIVGVYEAPELVSDRTPSQHVAKLAAKIAELNGKDKEGLLLLVNNATLLSPDNHSLNGYSVAAGVSGKGEVKPKALQGSSVSLEDEKKVLAGMEAAVRKEKVWEGLVDFDDHLEDPSLDWLQNSAITA